MRYSMQLAQKLRDASGERHTIIAQVRRKNVVSSQPAIKQMCLCRLVWCTHADALVNPKMIIHDSDLASQIVLPQQHMVLRCCWGYVYVLWSAGGLRGLALLKQAHKLCDACDTTHVTTLVDSADLHVP